MATNTIRVGNAEILALSDGLLEFDLCNFFPTIPQEQWQPYEAHLTAEHQVRFNLGSFLVRSDGRTILVDTGLGPKPVDAPEAPWGQLPPPFPAARPAAVPSGPPNGAPLPPAAAPVQPQPQSRSTALCRAAGAAGAGGAGGAA
jgi:hypothetical protein